MFGDIFNKDDASKGKPKETKRTYEPVTSAPAMPVTETSKSTTYESKNTSSKSTMNSKAYFSEDVEFKGTLYFDSSMEINGKFEGEITSEGSLIIGVSALIKGDIVAPNVVVKGKIQGNIVARERVELHSGAHLYGNVRTPQFVLSEGVTFVGSSDTLEETKTATDFTSIFAKLGKTAFSKKDSSHKSSSAHSSPSSTTASE